MSTVDEDSDNGGKIEKRYCSHIDEDGIECGKRLNILSGNFCATHTKERERFYNNQLRQMDAIIDRQRLRNTRQQRHINRGMKMRAFLLESIYINQLQIKDANAKLLRFRMPIITALDVRKYAEEKQEGKEDEQNAQELEKMNLNEKEKIMLGLKKNNQMETE